MTSWCDIIIPVWNQPELTLKCLESIAQFTPEPHHVIVIDNGSDEPTRKLLEGFTGESGISVITNEENLGFAKAVNQGIEASEADFLCFINNDVAVTKGWLKELIEVAESSGEIGLVNPFTTNASKILGDFPVGKERFYRSETAKGFCLLTKRNVIEAVGAWDEGYRIGFSEDRDFSRRAEDAGFQAVVAVNAFVHHEESASFRLRADRKELFEENRKRFEERWGPFPQVAFITNKGFFNDRERARTTYGEFLKLALKHCSVHFYFADAPSRETEKLVGFFGQPRLELMKYKFPPGLAKHVYKKWISARLSRLSRNKARAYDAVVLDDMSQLPWLKSLEKAGKSSLYLGTTEGFVPLPSGSGRALDLEAFHEECIEKARQKVVSS